jgi:putative transposase
MGRGKKYQPEQVVNLLRQIEVAVANGKTTALACKEAGIVEQTYFRWRKEYGGLQVDQAKRLKELEQENSKLKRLVANAPSTSRRIARSEVKGSSEAEALPWRKCPNYLRSSVRQGAPPAARRAKDAALTDASAPGEALLGEECLLLMCPETHEWATAAMPSAAVEEETPSLSLTA